MRYLGKEEVHQRGCDVCIELIRKRGVIENKKHVSFACPHKVCPYHEMDNFDSYTKFVHSDAALCNIPDIPRGLIF